MAASKRMMEIQARKMQTEKEVSEMSPGDAQAEMNAQRNLVVDSVNVAIAPKIIDPMEESRRAKLAMLQSRTILTDPTLHKNGVNPFTDHRINFKAPEATVEGAGVSATQTVVANAAVAVIEEHKDLFQAPVDAGRPPEQIGIMPPRRIGSYELRIIVKTDGTMVSEDRPCICGAPKRQWHKICLRTYPA